jgi:PAS domain S-box-containing protein
MFVVGRDGRVELWNGAAERSSGRVRQHVLGYSLPEAIPELASTELPSAIAESMQTNRSIVLQDLRYFANGGERTFEARVFPFEGSATVFFNDVTERKLLQDQLIQAQKMESIGRLAGGVAHDFNNLLTVISGYSELLLARRGIGNPVLGHVTEIQRAAARAASLTRQLLAFSRQQVLEPQVLDLNVIISNTDKMLRRLIGEDIELVTIAGTALGRVKADAGQMEQVVMNLAVNARDAMPKGGRLTIETANVELDEAYARRHVAVKPGPHVMLAMSDTGMGMDSETQARIFEPFFTTKEKGKGTGLGLATVYGIVKQSGGNIYVYSNLGHGTTFKIYLPRVDGALESVNTPKARTEVPQGCETVLLVEDEESVRSLLQGILRSNGYTVLEASRGEEALGICEGHKGAIHLLLADVVMPQMSGRELAERLISTRPQMKVLYMSGYTDDAVVRHGVLESNAAFLQKPFTPEILARKVRLVLDAP